MGRSKRYLGGKRGLSESAMYQIRVQGKLDERWSEWFNCMMIASESGITTLTGAVADQAALRSILTRIWDLNLTLISVTRTEMDPKQEGSRSSE